MRISPDCFAPDDFAPDDFAEDFMTLSFRRGSQVNELIASLACAHAKQEACPHRVPPTRRGELEARPQVAAKPLVEE
jgi:hypothetical protein